MGAGWEPADLFVSHIFYPGHKKDTWDTRLINKETEFSQILAVLLASPFWLRHFENNLLNSFSSQILRRVDCIRLMLELLLGGLIKVH